MKAIARSVQAVARKLGLDVHRYLPHTQPALSKEAALAWELSTLRQWDGEAAELLRRFAAYLGQSHAQLFQDIFALQSLDFKRSGFFVEFGATNGVDLSNTLLLERHYGWRGILAEPAKAWHEALRRNRTADICTDCVWSSSGERLMFNETTAFNELSTIDAFSSIDAHAKAREAGSRYVVESVSLMDMLERYGAPREIDYLSVDTEGSEFDILGAFDFSAYRIGVITVEHNFTTAREKIYALLTENGFARKYEAISQFDDWYVRA